MTMTNVLGAVELLPDGEAFGPLSAAADEAISDGGIVVVGGYVVVSDLAMAEWCVNGLRPPPTYRLHLGATYRSVWIYRDLRGAL